MQRKVGLLCWGKEHSSHTQLIQFTTITPAHYVRPHEVRPYRRKDGTFVSGCWRDGDGDSTINRNTGYFARNPNAIPQVLKKGGKL